MALPVRRGATGGLTGRLMPGWKNPLTEFDELFSRMESLLESTMGGALTESAAWTPLADFTETDDSYRIEVEVPGVKRDDINIEVMDRELVISGEYTERERTGLLRHSTRRVGRFEHRTLLPGDFDADGINATLSDGVLTVTVPKAESSRTRRIEISTRD
ncbi:Hsp20/alpha crystallin family protein [Streptomyces sp. LB8]|uniref:Hsp20/alpha crystallin family protein n=1 Tax=Streptomyces sp. LB8 TaxID=3042509 RepID=UPI0026479EB0|nr:Hsp20/alpha crystallin family protein [Streptomyces sp. LB8]MDN5384834.1 Hsp20/alpha crystallin family protein [Streptomyces sp. LB8]